MVEVSDIPSYTIPELFLWGVMVAILFVCGFYFINIAHKKEDYKERNVLYAFSCLFFGFALARAFYFLNKTQFQGVVIDLRFYGYEGYSYSEIFNLLEGIAPLIIFACLVFVFEKTFIRTKYIFTISNIVFVFLIYISKTFFLGTLVSDLTTIIVIIDFSLFILIIFMLVKRSPPEFQFTLVSFLIGTLIIFAGHALVTLELGDELMFDLGIPRELAPVLHIIGALVMVSPTIINPRFFTRFLFYWKLIALTFAALSPFLFYMVIMYIYLPYSGQQLHPVLVLIGAIAFSAITAFSLYQIIRIAKKKRIQRSDVDEKEFLQIFSKPQRITEEEVSISKEKKICLVCKGKLGRLLYMCPDCNSFYCKKCADTLVTLENACWVCDAPFDATKPTKVSAKEEDEVLEKSLDKKDKKKKSIKVPKSSIMK
jgi:hypothetical protein